MNVSKGAMLGVEYLLDALPVERFRFVAACGTRIEGIGTPSSDFDVYVLCDELPTLETFSRVSTFAELLDESERFVDDQGYVRTAYLCTPDNSAHFDILFICIGELEQYFSEVRERARRVIEDENIFYSSVALPGDYASRHFVHRLTGGHALHGGDQFSEVLSKLPTEEWRVLALTELAVDHPIVYDVAGFLAGGDVLAGTEAVRTMVLRHTHACVVALGCTNVSSKWVLSYRYMLGEHLGRQLIKLLDGTVASQHDLRERAEAAILYMEEAQKFAMRSCAAKSVVDKLRGVREALRRGYAARKGGHKLAQDAYDLRMWALGQSDTCNLRSIIETFIK